MTEEKRVTIEIETQLYDELEALAKREGRTIDDLAEEAFRDVLADPEKFLGLKP